jgi:hypothetical protein
MELVERAIAAAFPGVAGADAPDGVVALTALENAESPAEFEAATRYQYVVPAERPESEKELPATMELPPQEPGLPPTSEARWTL